MNNSVRRYNSIATLGDPPINHLTSSYYVADKLALADGIVCYASFEESVQAVKLGKAEAAMIAGAYPEIRKIIMDEQLICVEAFVAEIPPLVVCGMQPELPLMVEIVYLHSATHSLLNDMKSKYDKAVETQATSIAAALAQEDSDSLAICNQLAADYYGLHVHQVLRAGLMMPFSIFKLRQ